jgi:hypothetical protein
VLGRRAAPDPHRSASRSAPADEKRCCRTLCFTPPRGRSFQKFSFDFPELSVAFEGFTFGFRIFTGENVYTLAAEQTAVVLSPVASSSPVRGSCGREDIPR